MNKDKALSIVASTLAIDTCRHLQSAIDVPCLKQNSRDAASKNRDVAIALDIDDLYSAKLAIHLPDVK